MRVGDNDGSNIGYPMEVVDVEHGGVPVGIDTAGNVDLSEYSRNKFEEVNGKCIDLDGFHDGSVRGNECVNHKPLANYPVSQFGIVMNNTNRGMRSENIEIAGNHIDGTKYGGLFLIGSGHHIVGNNFEHLNLAHCNGETRLRLAFTRATNRRCSNPGSTSDEAAHGQSGHTLTWFGENRISGYQMKSRCIASAIERKARPEHDRRQPVRR